ncbi:hypothetical protein FO519_008823, partial [Halicephalobus sp. NKZ332]
MRKCSEESCSGHGYVLPKNMNSSDFRCECLCEENYSGNRCEIVSPCRDVECFNRGKCFLNSDQEAECRCSTEIQLFGDTVISGNFCQIIEIPDSTLENSEFKDCIPCEGSFQKWYYCIQNSLDVDSDDLAPLWENCEDDEGNRCWDMLKRRSCLERSKCTVSIDYLPFKKYKNKLFLTPHCICKEGYEGRFCQKKSKDPCYTSEEENEAGFYKCLHGTCIHNKYQGIRCLCERGYEGPRCDVVNPCSPDPCEGALCVKINGETGEPKHACICKLDQDVDSDTMKCKTPHHAICQTEAGNPVCLHGGHCYPCALDSESLNLCSEPESKRGFRCICPPGYLPPFCDDSVTSCSFHRCLNGAKCRPVNGSSVDYICECRLGYTGTFCERAPGICISRGFATCVHGRCSESNRSARGFICECEQGFYGFDCQYEIEVNLAEEIN